MVIPASKTTWKKTTEDILTVLYPYMKTTPVVDEAGVLAGDFECHPASKLSLSCAARALAKFVEVVHPRDEKIEEKL